MIGVIAESAEHDVVREFFELFKTPWEFYQKNRQYEVLISTGSGEFDKSAKVVILYSGRKTAFDDQENVRSGSHERRTCILSSQGQIPIYGDTIGFPEKAGGLLTDEGSRECIAYLNQFRGGAFARIGYDLFGEVRALLTAGQPITSASVPTLELHIALLRNLITGCGVSLVEIPPVPSGHSFITCLTHDVDHPSIRQHKWDHTTAGFLYRAIFGSLRDLFRKRTSLRDLAKNWAAALKLPFVHLGFAKDCWRDFDERYLEVEKGLGSTYFVIPFKSYPGRKSDGPAPSFRASGYGARDIATTIRKLQISGCEIALHGLDAWLDDSSGHKELEEIRRLTEVSEIGVRMHWLYYDQQSASTLEKAGAIYDSTVGYNQTVGYRAGTTQVYKPLDTSRLLELPLNVMDTALFYPAYLGLSREQARERLSQMGDNAVQFGGCLTINWHDRSLAPERLWDAPYRELVQDLKSRGAWFSTAGQAVSWFRKRRSVVFETDCSEPDAVRARVVIDHADGLPALRLRIHNARNTCALGCSTSEDFIDMAFDECIEAPAPCRVSK